LDDHALPLLKLPEAALGKREASDLPGLCGGQEAWAGIMVHHVSARGTVLDLADPPLFGVNLRVDALLCLEREPFHPGVIDQALNGGALVGLVLQWLVEAVWIEEENLDLSVVRPETQGLAWVGAISMP